MTDRGPSRWSWLPGGLSVLLFGAALAGQAVLHEPVVRERAASLLEELQRVDAQQAGQLLDRLGDDPQLTAAQRDAVAMALVRRLRQMPPGRIDRTVVDHLAEWTPRAWRRHEESASLQVPLFNVAAATRGLINQWDWQAGAADIAGTGGPPLDAVLDRVAARPDAPYARGVRKALSGLSGARLDQVIALSRQRPALSDTLLPELWLARGAWDELATWLRTAPVPRAAPVLGRAASDLSAEGFLPLGEAALNHPEPGLRALAMAYQTDAWMSRPGWPQGWSRRLWAHIDDRDLAATAALQLARLDAPARWRAKPALAPPGALQSPHLARIEALAGVSRSGGAGGKRQR
ncbi:MAG: hypothetical protein HND55_05665 [Pseudomonadota bacterium]|nr:MAG: hypothetical protein HND55_05665 [Pseudomonadota bacterium]